MEVNQSLTDAQFNILKLASYVLTAVGVISFPVDFPYHIIVGAIIVVIGAIGSGLTNYLTKPDTVTLVDNSANITQAIIKAIQTVKTEQANPTPQAPVDPAKVVAAMQEAANKAIEAYKAQVAADAPKPVVVA